MKLKASVNHFYTVKIIFKFLSKINSYGINEKFEFCRKCHNRYLIIMAVYNILKFLIYFIMVSQKEFWRNKNVIDFDVVSISYIIISFELSVTSVTFIDCFKARKIAEIYRIINLVDFKLGYIVKNRLPLLFKIRFLYFIYLYVSFTFYLCYFFIGKYTTIVLFQLYCVFSKMHQFFSAEILSCVIECQSEHLKIINYNLYGGRCGVESLLNFYYIGRSCLMTNRSYGLHMIFIIFANCQNAFLNFYKLYLHWLYYFDTDAVTLIISIFYYELFVLSTLSYSSHKLKLQVR